MVTRMRTIKSRPSPVGVVAAVVVSFVSLILCYNFQDARSFSSTTPLSLSSRHHGAPAPGNDACGEWYGRLYTNTICNYSSGKYGPKPKKKMNRKYKDRKEQQERERDRRYLQNKLQRICDAIYYLGRDSRHGWEDGPSGILRSGILGEIADTYTFAMMESSRPDDDQMAVQELYDPWVLKNVLLGESRQVQERFLSLLAVMIQVLTHIEDEYTLYRNNGGAAAETNPQAIDHIRFTKSRLWDTIRKILVDMAAAAGNEDTETPKKLPHTVSPLAASAVAKALRGLCSKFRYQSGIFNGVDGANELRELVRLINSIKESVAQSDPHADVDGLERTAVMAWNNYLSSLCDQALSTRNPSDAGLEKAAMALMQGDGGEAVRSSIVSYNTVMNVAARVGNVTLVDELWRDLNAKRNQQEEGGQFPLKPNSVTYNCRLMTTNDNEQRLEILNQEIIPAAIRLQRQVANGTADVSSDSMIDGYTIDLVMMPLLRANRKNRLFRLVNHWMAIVIRQQNASPRNQSTDGTFASTQRTFQKCLRAFFISLVQDNGDVRTAREFWNRYMLLDNDSKSDDYGKDQSLSTDAFIRDTNIVHRERKFYNILLDGYARLVDKARDRQSRDLERAPTNIGSPGNEQTPETKKIWQSSWEGDEDDEDDDPDARSTPEFYAEVKEKAINDGQELFADMMEGAGPGPDAYTISTMIRLCQSGEEIQNFLLNFCDSTATGQTSISRALTRTAVTTCGRIGDPSMACVIFDQYMFPDNNFVDNHMHLSNHRAFNVLLGALASGARMKNPILDVLPNGSTEELNSSSSFLSNLHGLTCTEAVVYIMNLMATRISQTYTVAASALQYAPPHERLKLLETANNSTDGDQEETTNIALQIFHNATRDGIQFDGRLVNAIFRCYGDDIGGALDGWKTSYRKAILEHKGFGESEATAKRNMLAAYNGLLYVCGRAERPDIAVRIVYAMKNKERLNPSENPYNNYRSGKIIRKNLLQSDGEESSWRGLRLPKIRMAGQYENILYVECKEFNTRDRRTKKDTKIRILV